MAQHKQSGFSHHFILPFIVIIAVGAIGIYTMTRSRAQVATSTSSTLRIGTYNIMGGGNTDCDLAANSRWSKRIPVVAQNIKDAHVDIMTITEFDRPTSKAKRDSCDKGGSSSDLAKVLGGNWKVSKYHKAASHKEGKTKITDSPYRQNEAGFVYNTATVTLKKEATYRYQDYKTSTNKSCDRSYRSRYMTVGLFQQISTGQTFYVVSAHPKEGDSAGCVAIREKQATKILQKIASFMTAIKNDKKLAAAASSPVVIAGDMNVACAGGDCAEAIDTVFGAKGFKDVTKVAGVPLSNQTSATYIGLAKYDATADTDRKKTSLKKTKECIKVNGTNKCSTHYWRYATKIAGDEGTGEGKRLDRIYVQASANTAVRVLGCTTDVSAAIASDHRPVFTDIQFDQNSALGVIAGSSTSANTAASIPAAPLAEYQGQAEDDGTVLLPSEE